MNAPQLHPQGYWLSHEEGHVDCFDPVLVQELTALFDGKAVCDLGCGLGKYVQWLRKRGIACDGYDGNPNTSELTAGVCETLNLAEEIKLNRKYDVVMSLEVGEHIPKCYESVFLDNVAQHAKHTVVMSWAIPGQPGDGHVNCQTNSYIIYQLWKRRFRPQFATSVMLRRNSSLPWFENTLMVFSRRSPKFCTAELKAAARILLSDLQRMNRSNSSIAGAVLGKMCRILSPVNRMPRWLRNTLGKV
jgi:hypothetical protein